MTETNIRNIYSHFHTTVAVILVGGANVTTPRVSKNRRNFDLFQYSVLGEDEEDLRKSLANIENIEEYCFGTIHQ